MELEFDVKVTTASLYDYMLRHIYTKLQGILATMTGVLIIIGFMITGYPIYLIAGIIIIAYLPWTFYLKAKQQVLNTPAFKEPLHYKLTEEGIEVSQNGETQKQVWEAMVKAVSTRESIIVYTSAVNASIFPRKDMKDLTPAVIQMISTHMSREKVKIRG